MCEYIRITIPISVKLQRKLHFCSHRELSRRFHYATVTKSHKFKNGRNNCTQCSQITKGFKNGSSNEQHLAVFFLLPFLLFCNFKMLGEEPFFQWLSRKKYRVQSLQVLFTRLYISLSSYYIWKIAKWGTPNKTYRYSKCSIKRTKLLYNKIIYVLGF